MQTNKDNQMITLQQAIKLANEAHTGQWCKSEPLDKESMNLFLELSNDTLFPYILSNGTKVFYLENNLVMQKPYITHPLAVMGLMSTEEEKIVAVLHDVFEDSTAQLCNHAKEYNFNERDYSIRFVDITYSITSNLWAALYALTKTNDDWNRFKEKECYQSYAGYIHDLSLNKTATKVKIADIVHNLSCSPSDHAKQKYLKAIPVLLKSL